MDISGLNLARWSDRFFAWLIDFIIVTIAFELLFYKSTFPLWLDNNPLNWFKGELGSESYAIRSLMFLAYWTYLESSIGGNQSIGKRIFRLKTVGVFGGSVNIRDALIESFGKSFLLPIDLILGWVFTNNKKQRIFNRASNTVVIKQLL
jgi:uncharacterized RDD family membrane protein YckC